MAKIYQLPARKAPAALDGANRHDPFVKWREPAELAKVFDDRPDLYASEPLRGPEPRLGALAIAVVLVIGFCAGLLVTAGLAWLIAATVFA